ncbi:hypothetical protein [Bradyrhizobium sp. STM 3843]|uniref:hypothetical protein n=1 Tax=Bradyrhizobium sp. STM 3843 TaxID=551947 RepID=UPI0009FDF39B|nr:hypothetical protein [Bradyrhizobium sp. STM 3843]
MTARTTTYCATFGALLFAASPAQAGACEPSIASVQAQVDAAIEQSAGSDQWKPESLDALRGHQPTPRSLAQTEGRNGADLQLALDALERARAADRSGQIAACHRELSQAKLILVQQRQ